MPNIEILAYCPIYMRDFLYFCVNGAPDGHGGWLLDPQGRKKTGVFRWLYGRNVPEAHFYISDPADPVQVFAATVQRLEQVPVPWMDNIPGFKDLLTSDGLVGTASAFPTLAKPIATISSNGDLDKKFEDGRTNLEKILASLRDDHETKKWTFTPEDLRGALRGDAGSDLPRMLAEINEKLPNTPI